MTTPSYTKDYNPLRITDLWKYERPKDINRDQRVINARNKSVAVTLYDSVEDTYISAVSLYAMARMIGCAQVNVWRLHNNVLDSLLGNRYYRNKNEFIESKKHCINIFDNVTKETVSFSSTSEASLTLSVGWTSVNRLIKGQIQIMAGRYTLVK